MSPDPLGKRGHSGLFHKTSRLLKHLNMRNAEGNTFCLRKEGRRGGAGLGGQKRLRNTGSDTIDL